MVPSLGREKLQPRFPPTFSITLNTTQPQGQTVPWCPSESQPLPCAVGVLAGTTGAPTSAWEKTTPMRILTAELLEVGLQLLAGTEEDPSLLGAHHEGALLVHGDAGHLCVQLGKRRALRGGTGSERLQGQPCLAPPTLFQWDFFFSSHQKQCSGLGQNFMGFITSPKCFRKVSGCAIVCWKTRTIYPSFHFTFSYPKSKHSIVFL